MLEQRVRQGDRPARLRSWRLQPAGPGRYTGTLTDASGPVAVETRGDTLHIAFPMKGGFAATQWLKLADGGRVAQNVLVVTKLGVPVARLDETITRLGE